MTGSRLRAAKTTSSHGNPRPLFLKTEPAHRQLALGSRGDRVHISGQSTELGLVSLAALTPRGQRPDDSHMCGSALRRQENREELGLGPHGVLCPSKQPCWETPERQLWDLYSRKDLGLPAGAGKELSIPQTLSIPLHSRA